MLDKDSVNNEISVGVTFASLMAAISLFFTGAVISQYTSFGATIKVPVLFLIISTFSFIFSATIYNNAGTEVTLGKMKTVEKYMIYAKNIDEFLGLYLLIIATPLVIGALTDDNFLRFTTTLVALISIALYSQSKFSVLDKQLHHGKKQLYTVILVTLSLLLYISQTTKSLESTAYFTTVSIVLLATVLVPTIYFSLNSKQYNIVLIRPFKNIDVASIEKLIERNIQYYSRNKKYGKAYAEQAERMRKDYGQEALLGLSRSCQVFVATTGNRRIGFAVLSGNTIQTIFTEPEVQRKGVGRLLVDALEVAAGDAGFEEAETITSAASAGFFKRLDYEVIEKMDNGEVKLSKEL